jgi:hypothetical protein
MPCENPQLLTKKYIDAASFPSSVSGRLLSLSITTRTFSRLSVSRCSPHFVPKQTKIFSVLTRCFRSVVRVRCFSSTIRVPCFRSVVRARCFCIHGHFLILSSSVAFVSTHLGRPFGFDTGKEMVHNALEHGATWIL